VTEMMLIAPIKTEKSIGKIESNNALTFIVAVRATKKDIKKEVESMFKVKVLSVRTYLTQKGEKRAIVKLSKETKADEIATKLKLAT
jgi:large subunit ribosomal protein L23